MTMLDDDLSGICNSASMHQQEKEGAVSITFTCMYAQLCWHCLCLVTLYGMELSLGANIIQWQGIVSG